MLRTSGQALTLPVRLTTPTRHLLFTHMQRLIEMSYRIAGCQQYIGTPKRPMGYASGFNGTGEGPLPEA